MMKNNPHAYGADDIARFPPPTDLNTPSAWMMP
jgi:hypothetical protein